MNITEIRSFESRTKLMLSGEYLVLKGSLSLALPLKFSQKITVSENPGIPSVRWKSLINTNLWFSATLLLPHFEISETNDHHLAETLAKILTTARMLNPKFPENPGETEVNSVMNFDPTWGIGSSSSLISNIAYWTKCDPFELNKVIFNGSGYDIACARSSSPIIYELTDQKPSFRAANFIPPFRDRLYFVYLNHKQNSRESVQKADFSRVTSHDIAEISAITLALEATNNLETFQLLMNKHEEIIAKIIQIRPVKDLIFNDFNGSIKSLGAWGGDFVLAASAAPEEYVHNYFNQKNFNTIFRYEDIVML